MFSSFYSRSFFLLFVLLIPISGISQQTDTTYKVNGHTYVGYYSIHFTNDSSGWVVGDSGVIGHWIPTNNEWVDQPSGTDNRLYSVHFPMDDTGWVVGDSGTILHTNDGGNNWNTQLSGINSKLRSVYFTDTDTGWAVGDSGTVLYTEDGGSNWNSQTSGTLSGLKAVQFHDASLGWAVGDTGIVLRTTDGGTNWNIYPTSSDTLYDVSFVNDTLGWATGVKGGIAYTEDGGMTWSLQVDTSTWDETYFSIQMLDTATGWAFGYPVYEGKLYDLNSGSGWSTVLGNSFFFRARSHYFFSIDTGWIAYKTSSIQYFTNADSLQYDALKENRGGNMQVRAYPNPFEDRTVFRFKGTDFPRSFSLYTLQGEKVRSKRIRKRRKYVLDRKDLPDGVYLYQFMNEKGVIGRGKIIAR